MMNKNELKILAESLIDTFDVAGRKSINLYNEGLKIEIKKEAQDIEKVINNKTIEFQAKVHDETQLYGSISTTDLFIIS